MTTTEPTIDAHAHVFHRGLTLAAGRRYTPGYDAPLQRYLEKLDQNGLSHGLLVQPSFLGTDNSYLLDCLGCSGARLRGIAVVESTISRDELLLLNDAGVVGIRLNLIGRPVPGLGSHDWQALLRTVADLGWHVEVQRRAAEVAPIVASLLGAGVSVVLDHFGLPDPLADAEQPGWQELLAFGRSERVWVKLSAPYRLGSSGDHYARRLYPQLRDAFGLDRLMWGSDWPHTQFEGSQGFEDSRQYLSELCESPHEAAAVLASARDLFRL